MVSGIYVTDAEGGRLASAKFTRRLIVAKSADEAARITVKEQWPDVPEDEISESAEKYVEVNRLGDYGPGIAGARFAERTGAVLMTEAVTR